MTFICGWLFLGEIISLQKLFLALIVVGLLVIFSADRKQFTEYKKATLIPALASAFLFGVSAIPAKYLLTTLAATNAPTLYMFRAALIGVSLFFVYRSVYATISRSSYNKIFVESAVAIVQWLLLYTALQKGTSGITITLVNTVPIFTFIFGVLFLKEKITLKKVVATALILGLLFVM